MARARRQARPAPTIHARIVEGDPVDSQDLVQDQLIRKDASPGVGYSQVDESNGALDEIGSHVLTPPINFDTWAQAFNLSTRLARAISTMARNIVGLGYRIVPTDDQNIERMSGADKKKYLAQQETIKRLLRRPDKNLLSFTDRMYRVIVDRETIGNGWLEIVRDLEGKPVSIHHARGTTMRILKNDRGYVQLTSRGKKRYFKRYRDKRIVDARTGLVATKGLALEHRATEILHFLVYNPTSFAYGLPRHTAASPAIAGNRLAAIRNVVFFENDSVPRMAITVSGGRLAKESFEMIKQFLQTKAKGVENAHRVLLLETDDAKAWTPNGKNVRIDITPLTVGVQDDASHTSYRSQNNEEIREAYGLAEPYFATTEVNRASSVTAKKITQEQVFQPEKKQVEYFLNETVIRDVLELDEDEDALACLRFMDPDPVDLDEIARVQKTMSEIMAVTINESRHAMGKPPLPDDMVIGDIPAGLLKVLIASQQIGNPAHEMFDQLGVPGPIVAAPTSPGPQNPQDSEPDDAAVAAAEQRGQAKATKAYAGQIRALLKKAGIDASVGVQKAQPLMSFQLGGRQ